jgi:hypothetical protein
VKRTIKRLTQSIVGQAGEIAGDAEGMDNDSGISGAEAVIHLRDAQQALNRALEALRLSVHQTEDERQWAETVDP